MDSSTLSQKFLPVQAKHLWLWRAALLMGALLCSLLPHQALAAASRITKVVCPDNGDYSVELALKEYNYRHGGRFRMKRVSRDVYDYQLQKYLSFGRQPALFCTDPSGASRYYNDGWIEPLNGIKNYKRIKKQMLPNMQLSVTRNDLLLGVPYAGTVNGVAIVLDQVYNSNAYIKPLDWQQLYESAHKYTQRSKRPALLPAWWEGVISETFITEVMNRSRFREEDGMDLSGSVARQVLADWKKAFAEKVVPEDSLDIHEETAISRLKSGDYIYAVTSLKVFLESHRTKGVKGGSYSLLSGWGQNWGMLDIKMIAMTKQNSRSETEAENIRRFLHWFVFDDKATKINSTERVLKKAMLFPAIRPDDSRIVVSEGVSAAPGATILAERALSIYRRAKYPASVLAIPTAHEFKQALSGILVSFLKEKSNQDDSIRSIKSLMQKHRIRKHT